MGSLEMRDPRPLLSIIYCPHHTGALTLNFSSLAVSLNLGPMDGCQGIYVHSKFHESVCELGCIHAYVHISDNRFHSFHLGLRVVL